MNEEVSRALDLGEKEDGTKYKFLIVDDSDFILKNLTRMIQSFGGEVLNQAQNGKEAVKIYEKVYDQIDLITLDITMPEMNGIECLGKLREINPDAKIIMCTALGHQDLVKQAILRGAKHYVVKPFHRDKVFEVFKIVLAK